ncbi:MAG: HEPN domain-containing protein, partial [Anaerolineae bacterium]
SAQLRCSLLSLPAMRRKVLELCLLHDGTFESQREGLKDLTRYAVEFRYPGELATKEDARAAFEAMKVVRAFVRQKLGLD